MSYFMTTISTRGKKRFLTLINLIGMFDKTTAQYYLNCVDNDDWSLVTESLLLEMETSLTDCTMEVDCCDM